MDFQVLLIGCGNMGFAMLQGWLANGLPPQAIHVVEPASELRTRASALAVTTWAEASNLPTDARFAIAVVAVKPQIIAGLLPHYRAYAAAGTTFVSVAAGTLIKTFEAILGETTAVIRCMPNTPAAIGKGMMVCCANSGVSKEARAFCEQLLESSGRVAFVEDETLMDAVTGVSGSGPAYVFHFIESLAYAGLAAGLPEDLAQTLALQTVYGAATLAAQSLDNAAKLRMNVTSPNGTTAAALEILMGEGRLQNLVTEAVVAASERSRALSKQTP